MKEEELIKIEGILKNMNPTANVVRTTRSNVPLDHVLNTKSFDLEKAATSPGWMKVMRGEAVIPETEEYNVSSFVYRRRTPFHPKRLYELLDKKEPLPGVIRSKGFCWFANLNDEMFSWASAGVMYEIAPDMMKWFVFFFSFFFFAFLFYPLLLDAILFNSFHVFFLLHPLSPPFPPSLHRFAATPKEEWGMELDYKSILMDFEGETGDRRQEIVVIGHAMDSKKIIELLDECLLKEGEKIEELEDPWRFEEMLKQMMEAAEEEEEEEDDEEGSDDDEEEEEEGEKKAKPHHHHNHKHPHKH